jgi:nifR3 family TIM-barrel protein
MGSFWEKLKKPISASAPMAGVSDSAFRAMLARHGKPDVMWTEMVSLAGAAIRGESEFENEMSFGEMEHPIVFQFFGSFPEEFSICGKLAKSRGADGIDINMGCPDKGVEKQGAGACIIKSPALAKELVAAAMDGSNGLPVSVKTRIGYANAGEMEGWITALAEAKPAAITIHGRTRAEKRKGRANWDSIGDAGRIIKSISPGTVVLGNGDVGSKEEGERWAQKAEVDGYMAGRALIGNPWFFTGHKATKKERIAAAKEHIEIFDKLLGEKESFDMVKKHLAGYMSGFLGAKKMREKLMAARNAAMALKIIGESALH